jgi:hypothetical protein
LNVKVVPMVEKTEINLRGTRCTDHESPSTHKSWHQLLLQVAAARSVGTVHLRTESHGVYLLNQTDAEFETAEKQP